MNDMIPPELAWLEDPDLVAALHREVAFRIRNRRLWRHARRAATPFH